VRHLRRVVRFAVTPPIIKFVNKSVTSHHACPTKMYTIAGCESGDTKGENMGWVTIEPARGATFLASGSLGDLIVGAC